MRPGSHAQAPATPGRSGPIAAWALLTLTGTLGAAAVTGAALARPAWQPTLLYALVDLTDGLVYGAIGWLLLRRGTHPAGWIVAAAGAGGTVAAAATSWALLAQRWPHCWAPPQALSAAGWAWLPGFYAFMVVLPWLLPAGATSRTARTAVAAGTAFIAIAEICVLTAPAPYGLLPLDDPGLRALRRLVLPWVEPVLVLLCLAAAAGVHLRRRVAPATQRPGLGWLTIGLILLALAFVPLAARWIRPQPLLPATVPPLLMLAAQTCYPAAVLVVVLRQQLWGITLTVRRTIVWGLLTALAVAGYLSTVTLLGTLVPAGQSQVLCTALLAAAFAPLRHWVQRRVDVLVHGQPAGPVIRQVGDRLRGAQRGADVLHAVAGAIRSSLRLQQVTITTDDAALSVRSGTGAGGRPVSVPLRVRGREVGRLQVWPPAGERLDGRGAEVLADLSPVVAALTDLATTHHHLAQARQDVARARDEERRRLRRDLHDGLSPALSGAGLALSAAGNLLAPHRHLPGVADAAALLTHVTADLTRHGDDVRTLARDLLPPMLDEGALLAALHRLRERYAAAGLTVDVVGCAATLSEDTATAIYGIVAEALHNVHRHAHARHCVVRVQATAAELEVTVIDRGIGAGAARPGLGTRSMRERAHGIGADLTVGPATDHPGRPGTRVRLTVPLAPA
ncbi:sensor histidine kinase [Actinoplanes teichomyceticus]|uniref:histidine kinase n=1 Tax=Actinoplanes teichomyceticus TaxID=1867 RepID=A0A561VM91_ACTTI|nr:histidine kinase [Actinoplanes teichomyceticus]TWG12738.1 histidine kinase [Actinoplanes teichomyceticus]GIF13471.1 hypothetical protein Ate01nite_35030 [Actinoplanes teichomyceticus]